LGGGEQLASKERAALTWFLLVVTVLVVLCLAAGWREEPSQPIGWMADVVAAGVLIYYVALIWLGSSSSDPVGFHLGGNPYLDLGSGTVSTRPT
jgi:hypothetical protein